MRQLLAYLLVRLHDGSWEVGSHRGLETLVAAWRAVPDTFACGVVHVGFWRPDTDQFKHIASGFSGQVLLTEPARWALPEYFRCSAGPVGSAAGIPVYRGLSGWGYDVSEEVEEAEKVLLPEEQGSFLTVSLGAENVAEPWLDWVRSIRPEVWRTALAAGIVDDASYLDRERRLPGPARDELGARRMRWFARCDISESNILANLVSAPPWLLEVEFYYLRLSTRPRNRLAAAGLARISDFAPFGESWGSHISGLGRRSVAEIAERVYDCFRRGSTYCAQYASALVGVPSLTAEETGTPLPPSSRTDTAPVSFFNGLEAALAHCEDRDAKVLKLRMGLCGPPPTLEAVGSTLLLTRERVRQIEKRAVKRIATLFQPWIVRIGEGVEAALAGRDEPLPLVGLEILDSWFAGVGENEGPLLFAFEHFFDLQPFWLLKADGQTFVSQIAPDEWAEALRKTKVLLADMVGGDQSVLETDARCLSDSMLPEAAAALRPLFWSHVTRSANFSITPEGTRHLVSFGQGGESVVEAILIESDRPLHYEEIA